MKRLSEVEGNPIDIRIFMNTQTSTTLERKDYITVTISWNSDAQLTLRGNTIYYLIFSGREF